MESFVVRTLTGQDLGSDEFFGELRSHNIEHLGQIRYAILEDTGRISVFYFPDDEVIPGLPILPDDYNKKQQQITKSGSVCLCEMWDTYKLGNC